MPKTPLAFHRNPCDKSSKSLEAEKHPKKKKKKNVNRLAGVGPGSCLTCRDVSSLAWLNAQSERLKPRGSLYTRDISAVMLL